ncbi:hypothetical protein [Thomasclavelia sp.]
MLKKIISVIGCILGVIGGFLVIWKMVIPFIGYIFSWFTSVL